MADISYLSGWQTTRDGPYPSDPIRYYATIASGSFAANRSYLVLFGLAYHANIPNYFIDVQLELPDGTVKQRLTLGTTSAYHKNFSGAVVVTTGATPTVCRFRVQVLTTQPTGAVYIDDGMLIAIDLTTGLRTNNDIVSYSNSGAGTAKGNTYSSNTLITGTIPATTESTDWLVLSSISFISTVNTASTVFGSQLYDNSASTVLQTREENKASTTVTSSGLGTDRGSLGGMYVVRNNTASKSIKLQCIGDSDWGDQYASLIFIRLNRFKNLIVDQGTHSGAVISGSGTYNVVPMGGSSLPSEGTQGQIYIWAATMSASPGSGCDFETRDGSSAILALVSYFYSPQVWRSSEAFWVMTPYREQSLSTFYPNTRAVAKSGSTALYSYRGVAFGTTLAPIQMAPVNLNMVIAQTIPKTAGLEVAIAGTYTRASNLNVAIAETKYRTTSLDMQISLVITKTTNLSLAIAAIRTIDADLDIHLSGVEYLTARLNVLAAEHRETAPINLNVAIAEPYTRSAGLEVVISDAPHMVLEPDRPRYLADIDVQDFQTTASPNGWSSPSIDFAAQGVARRDVVEIKEGMNQGNYVVREVQGHVLLTEEFIRHPEAGPIKGEIRKERDLTAQFTAAAVLDQPMFMAGKSFYCMLDMLIQ